MIGPSERRRCAKMDVSVGGLILGSVVACPHRKQIRALVAISVPQCLQVIAVC
jgi:hypothetical protein